MPVGREAARDEFKRILREINKSFCEVYDMEGEIAWLIMKYCDFNSIKKKMKALIEIE